MSTELNTSVSSAFAFAPPEQLKIDLLSAAYGIPKATPVFSWVMRSGEIGDIQTSYRIVIAKRMSDMQDGDYLLDTGWVATDESSNVQIAGLDTILQDNELYYWAVQLRNKSGLEGALSEPMPFSTAVGNAWEDTHGIWSEDRVEEGAEDGTAGAGNFSFLRTEFRVPYFDDMERAVLSVTATSPEPSR